MEKLYNSVIVHIEALSRPKFSNYYYLYKIFETYTKMEISNFEIKKINLGPARGHRKNGVQAANGSPEDADERQEGQEEIRPSGWRTGMIIFDYINSSHNCLMKV